MVINACAYYQHRGGVLGNHMLCKEQKISHTENVRFLDVRKLICYKHLTFSIRVKPHGGKFTVQALHEAMHKDHIYVCTIHSSS